MRADLPDAQGGGPSVGDLALALRAVWLPVVVFVAVAAAAGAVLGTTSDTAYEATSTVAVADARTQTGVFGGPVPGAAIEREEAQLLATSAAVRLRVAERLGSSPDGIEDVDATVSEDRDDPFIELTARAGSSTRAVDLANAFAAALVDERRARLGAQLDELITTLRVAVDERRGEITALDAELAAGGVPDDPEIGDRRRAAVGALTALRERLAELEIEAEAASGGVAVVDPAVQASSVPGPEPVHLAVLGALVAAVLAVAIVYVRLSYDMARTAARPAAARVIDLDGPGERRASGVP